MHNREEYIIENTLFATYVNKLFWLHSGYMHCEDVRNNMHGKLRGYIESLYDTRTIYYDEYSKLCDILCKFEDYNNTL